MYVTLHSSTCIIYMYPMKRPIATECVPATLHSSTSIIYMYPMKRSKCIYGTQLSTPCRFWLPYTSGRAAGTHSVAIGTECLRVARPDGWHAASGIPSISTVRMSAMVTKCERAARTFTKTSMYSLDATFNSMWINIWDATLTEYVCVSVKPDCKSIL